MPDGFGQFADAIQGASLTYLKLERSIDPWGIRQLQTKHAFLQVGWDGGAGLLHGVTDPSLIIVLMQVTDFDDRVFVDGFPFTSHGLIVFPPECHFAIRHAGPVRWFSLAISRDENVSARLSWETAAKHLLNTEKRIMLLSPLAATKLRVAAVNAIGQDDRSAPALGTVESSLFGELRDALENIAGQIDLPSDHTRAAEQIVFRALHFVQSRPDEHIEIGELAKATGVNYRTMLRAFERYLSVSPKHYLKLRQANGVYHTIRKSKRTTRLADILNDHAVSEFGRFAGEYKTIFGELPSETHHRYREHDLVVPPKVHG